MDIPKYFKFLCFMKYLKMEIKIKKEKVLYLILCMYKWGTVILNLPIFSFLDERTKEKKKKNFES